jgi:hypothetical protein
MDPGLSSEIGERLPKMAAFFPPCSTGHEKIDKTVLVNIKNNQRNFRTVIDMKSSRNIIKVI